VAKKRTYGTGGLHEKHGSYYGRWRTLDGRQLNRLVGPVRTAGEKTGLTRSQAEAAFRRLQDEEARAPRPARDAVIPTVDDVTDSLRKKLRLRGLRRSYLEGCESMQRVHISPRLGSKPVSEVKTDHIEALASAMLDRGLAPKTVRNVMTFLHSIFEHAIDRRLMRENPVRRATRPGRRRQGDANPDLQFLTVEELDAVIRAVPDEVVHRQPAPTRRGRRGPAPPPPPDVLGPVLRVLILVAALTGLRQRASSSACAGATSTGARSASGCATRSCAASIPRMASPTSPRGARSRWPTGPRAPSRRGRASPHTAPTTTSSSPTRTRVSRWTAAR
jgi:hypothetical protein